MSVYFIRDTASGMVKIGYSNDARRRHQFLQTALPGTLELLCVIEGDRDAEAHLHTRFASLRVRGEWFKVDGELADLLRELPRYVAPSRKNGADASWNGLSTEAVARATGISSTFLCEIRKGKRRPSPEKAILIQRATGLSAIKLVFGELASEAA